jgi:hypothetical protein
MESTEAPDLGLDLVGANLYNDQWFPMNRDNTLRSFVSKESQGLHRGPDGSTWNCGWEGF